MEKFFLITCVYNGKKYIEKLFNSLLNQTKINFVHYIYDDGSTDDISDLIKDYRDKSVRLNKNIRIIYEKCDKNKGLNYSTFHAISKCDCEYFIWIDCDNWVDPEFFEELENVSSRNKNALVIRTNTVGINENDLKPINKFKKRIPNRRNDIAIILDNYYYSFFAIKVDLYKKIDPDNFFINQKNFFNDTQLLFKCSLTPYDFVFAKKARGYMLHRVNSEYISNISKDYLSKEPLFTELINHLGISLQYNLIDILSIKNILIKIRENNINKNYFENLSLLREKRDLLKRNNISCKNGEVDMPDFVLFIYYFLKWLTN